MNTIAWDEKAEKEKLIPVEGAVKEIHDQENGTYLIKMAYPSAGKYDVQVKFDGTFKGQAGHIRGSPFRIMSLTAGPDADGSMNDLNGGPVMNEIRRQIKETKTYSERSLNTLKKHPPKDDLMH